jgi:hypothetical protein
MCTQSAEVHLNRATHQNDVVKKGHTHQLLANPKHSVLTASRLTSRVGQNRICTPYMHTVCMMITLPKIPYVHRIYL